MEITNEIKAKLFALYLGQQISIPKVKYSTQKWYCTTSTIVNIDAGLVDYDGTVLILKPPSAIMDKDAICVSSLVGGASHLSDESQIYQAKQLFISPNFFVNQTNIKAFGWLQAFQYLQSEGYDLPQCLLEGKTLFEAGLAIYEPNN